MANDTPNDVPTTPQSIPNIPYKPSRRIIIGAIVVLLVAMLCSCSTGIIIGSASAGGSTPKSVATTAARSHSTAKPVAPTATPKPKVWTVVQTFSGNGIQKTGTFDMSANDWRLVWTCDPSSFGGSNYNVIIDVYGSDGSLLDGAVNTLCASGNAGGTAEEHNVTGNLYLSIDSEAVWTAKVEVLQ